MIVLHKESVFIKYGQTGEKYFSHYSLLCIDAQSIIYYNKRKERLGKGHNGFQNKAVGI